MKNLLICMVLGAGLTLAAAGCGDSEEPVVIEEETTGDEMYVPGDADEVEVETDDGEVEDVEADY